MIAGISLAGKVAVITGASSGLGVETARTLAGAGARVLLLARDKDKLEGVARTLREDVPGASINVDIVDLADLGRVVSLSSGGHKFSDMHFEDPQF